jgi:hypothetical protein
MRFIRLRKTNELGEELGAVAFNAEQIVHVCPAVRGSGTKGEKTTQISTADGKTHWVLETTDQVLERIDKP